MNDYIKKFIQGIEKYSPRSYSIILAVPIIFLIIGFFIWTIYLYSFGFIVNELLKSRFILTGFWFLLLSLILLMLLESIVYFISWSAQIIERLFKVKSASFSFFNKNILYFLFFIIWFFIYIFKFFPIIPPFLGGGQPRSISLIANDNTMPILNSLTIQKGSGANNQTENICIVYEDASSVFVLRKDRVLMIDKSLFQGYGILPGTRSIPEQTCIEYAHTWSTQGNFFGYILFKTQIKNLFAPMIGWPREYFSLPKN